MNEKLTDEQKVEQLMIDLLELNDKSYTEYNPKSYIKEMMEYMIDRLKETNVGLDIYLGNVTGEDNEEYILLSMKISIPKRTYTFGTIFYTKLHEGMPILLTKTYADDDEPEDFNQVLFSQFMAILKSDPVNELIDFYSNDAKNNPYRLISALFKQLVEEQD